MKALILSGGGALGAFQVGAVKYAREIKGYRWDLVAGVSVGAMNGAMIALGKFQRLYEIWESEMSDRLMYGPLGRVPTGLLRLRSLYTESRKRRLLTRELQGQFQLPLRVGAVSLLTGDYVAFECKPGDNTSPYILDAVLASAAQPVISPPVDVGGDYREMVDGGIRNTSPLADVLANNPDEIMIINCFPRNPGPLDRRPRTVVGIGIRSYEVLANEILVEDVKEFELINALVTEAAKSGVILHHPRGGRVLRHVSCKIIEPDQSLGDGQDFSPERTAWRVSQGWEKAKQVLDRS